MWKRLRPIVPACLTFGPLFMVMGPEFNNPVQTWAGVYMLMVGLVIMFRLLPDDGSQP